MTRRFSWLFAAALLLGALNAQEKSPKVAEPAEEDETIVSRDREYTLNPIQAEEELKVGRFYQKKGSYRAAAMRYQEATKWFPGHAEAWLLLGEMREKMNDDEAARAAWEQYLELEPEGKQAAEIKKKMAKLKKAGGPGK